MARRVKGWRAPPCVVVPIGEASDMAAKKTSTAAKKTKAAAAPRGFAALVRRLMAERAPTYRFVATTGGSGPLLTFERPAAKSPRMREQVVFQKGLHGADWFRVNLFPMFLGEVAAGATTEHALLEGQTTGPDVRWKSPAELEKLLEESCTKLEAAASKFFGPFEAAYRGYEKLFGRLVSHYADWLRSPGAKLPADAAADDEFDSAGFQSFKAYLENKKLLAGLPGEMETPLWRFWTGSRPMRESDYQKGRHYDCSKCEAFTSRVALGSS